MCFKRSLNLRVSRNDMLQLNFCGVALSVLGAATLSCHLPRLPWRPRGWAPPAFLPRRYVARRRHRCRFPLGSLRHLKWIFKKNSVAIHYEHQCINKPKSHKVQWVSDCYLCHKLFVGSQVVCETRTEFAFKKKPCNTINMHYILFNFFFNQWNY